MALWAAATNPFAELPFANDCSVANDLLKQLWHPRLLPAEQPTRQAGRQRERGKAGGGRWVNGAKLLVSHAF